MPIYEYQCNNCEHQFEKLQKIKDAVLTECPECNQQQLKKLISASGFQLKGNGWYVTDFKGDKKPSSSKANASSKTTPVKNKTD